MPDLIPIRELPDLCYYNDPETVLHGDGQWEEVSGGGGVTDHSLLSGRSLADQHPIGAVTGLQGALDGKVSTSDQRLSDARTPTAHKTTHATGGTDALSPADIGAAASSHTHAQGDVTGLVADLAGKVGTGDSRLSDARTPTAHALSHATGGTDALSPAAIGARPAGNVPWSEIDNKPSIPAAQVNSDWTASSGVAQILHKPTIPSTPSDVGAAPAVRTVGTGLATSGTVNLDMAVLHGTIQTIALSGDVTFTTSNRAAGREITLVISAGGSSRTLTWPSWLFVGAALPTTLASGKTTVVTATCTDTTDAATIAAGAVQS